jgi:hypothetical protein
LLRRRLASFSLCRGGDLLGKSEGLEESPPCPPPARVRVLWLLGRRLRFVLPLLHVGCRDWDWLFPSLLGDLRRSLPSPDPSDLLPVRSGSSLLWLSLPRSVLADTLPFLDGGVVGARLACLAVGALALAPGWSFLGFLRATFLDLSSRSSTKGRSLGLLLSPSKWGGVSLLLLARRGCCLGDGYGSCLPGPSSRWRGRILN